MDQAVCDLFVDPWSMSTWLHAENDGSQLGDRVFPFNTYGDRAVFQTAAIASGMS
jgi:hypothetical protein